MYVLGRRTSTWVCFLYARAVSQTTREQTFVVARVLEPGATYRIGVGTNWANDPESRRHHRVQPAGARSPVTSRLARSWPVPTAVLVAGAAGLVFTRALGTRTNYDEGVYLASLDAMRRGQELGTELYTSQPPVFYWLLRALAAPFGSSIRTSAWRSRCSRSSAWRLRSRSAGVCTARPPELRPAHSSRSVLPTRRGRRR